MNDGANRSVLALASVSSAEGGVLDGLEVAHTLAGQEIEVFSTLLEQVLGIVIDNELCGILVRHEPELFSNEAKFDIWLESVTIYQHVMSHTTSSKKLLTLYTLHKEQRGARDRQTYPSGTRPRRAGPDRVERSGGSCPWPKPNERPGRA